MTTQSFREAISTSELTSSTVFAWYLDHSLPVTPLNPTTPRITVPSTRRSSRSISTSDDYATTFSPSHLQPKPSDFSLSVITPPAVTRKLLEEAERAGVRAVWLQPGSFDGETLGWAREVWKGACVGGGGACVLVQGEEGMELAGRVGDGEGMAESGKL